MPLQRLPFITLDECINAYLNESEQGIHKYYKLWHLAFDCMNELGLDFFYQIRSVKLPINSNLTVNLPSDYLNYSKVGVLNDRGEIIPLGYNNKLTTYSDLSANRVQNTTDNTIFDFNLFNNPFFFNNFWTGSFYETLYGIPSGGPFLGGFKIDITNGIILLNETFGYSYLMLEYVASPEQGQQYYIPIQFKQALIAYLRWRDIASLPASSHFNLGDKQLRRKDYYNERRLAIARYRPIYLEDAYIASQEQTRLVVKS